MKKAIILILIILGVADSVYLLYLNTQPYCNFGICTNLSIPLIPEYVPALLGILWFVLTIPALKSSVFAFLWRVAGIGGISFFSTYSLLNQYFCPYCFAAYLIGGSLIMLSIKWNRIFQ
jgi:hypothetical protein